MQEPKISVIITAYNVEEYIADCLNSVCNQTFRNMEIIVVNDGSTDNTLNIISAYHQKDKRIRIINQENRGAAAAKNVGLDYVTGDYIGFVDGDDVIAPDMYYILVNNAIDNKADLSEISIKKYKDVFIPDRTNENIIVLSGDEILKNFFLDKGHNSSLCTKIVRKDIITKYRMIAGLNNYEDAYLTYFCMKDCHTSVIEKSGLYGYRTRAGSQSSWEHFDKKNIDGCRQVSLIREDVLKNRKQLTEYVDCFLFNVCLTCVRLIAKDKECMKFEQSNLELVKDMLDKTYNNARYNISFGRKIEYWLLKNTRCGIYYMWKIIKRIG